MRTTAVPTSLIVRLSLYAVAFAALLALTGRPALQVLALVALVAAAFGFVRARRHVTAASVPAPVETAPTISA